MNKFDSKSLEQDYMQTSGGALLKLMQNNETPVLDLFVRESIQNSLDAALPDSNLVRVDFIYNTFDINKLAECYNEIEAPIKSKYFNKNKFISVSDKNTTGLIGNKNGLFSAKEENQNLGKLVFQIMHAQTREGAGGCWGIGKTVYYRLGQGLVIYYSRIKNGDGTYEERIISSLVEDDEKEDRLITKDGYLGITYFGEIINGKPNVVCDVNFIRKVLKIFNIAPYKDAETGTVIIIPFIEEEQILMSNGFEYRDNLFWDKTVPDSISMSLLRWYFPRINSKYNLGPKLEVYVNDKRIDLSSSSPIFEWFSKLYECAITGDIQNGIQLKSIERTRDLEDKELGKFAFVKLSRSQLKMSGDFSYDNLPSPFSYLNLKRDADSSNPPIVAYCRKPGMIVSYEISGNWVGSGVSGGSDFILGLFVLNSKNKIKEYDMSLEDYVRRSEKADHTSWADPLMENKKPKLLVGQIMNEVGMTLKETYLEKNSTIDEIVTNRCLGKKFADLLPTYNYGKESSIDERGRTHNTISKSKSTTISLVGEPTYEKDGMRVVFDVNCFRKFSSISFSLVVPTSERNMPIPEWEEKNGLPAMFEIKKGFIIFTDCDNTALNNYKITLDKNLQNTNGACKIEYEATKSNKIYKYKIINNGFSKCKLNISLFISINDNKYQAGLETYIEEVIENETL